MTARLETFLAGAAGAARVRVVSLDSLAGGAIQDNRSLIAEIEGGPFAGRLEAVLRMDAASRVAVSHDRAREFALLMCAHRAGAKVAAPLWLCADATVLGRPFFVMRRVPGIAAGHRVVKDADAGGYGEALAAQLGAALAEIHAIPVSLPELSFLSAPSGSPALALVAQYRDFLDDLPEPAPAVEWGLAWLARNAPPAQKIVLCHRDFRTGNYLVEEGRLTAVLDWEFAGLGDPDEDLGWFLAKCWRFGKIEREAGGIGARETFLAAYEKTSGRRVDRARLGYWEIMAHARWAVIALQQAERHASGAEESLELALTAHVVPELELEILDRTRDAA